MIEGERQVAPTLDGIREDHRFRYEWAARFIRPDSYVVDVACGVGYGTSILAQTCKHVSGFDLDAEALEYAKAHYRSPGTDFFRADAESPGHFGTQDAAVCFETIEHLQDPRPLLKALVKSAPLLFASVPNEDVLPFEYEPGKRYAFHFRHYRRTEFEDLLWECGWFITGWYRQEGPESDVEADPAGAGGRTLLVTAERWLGDRALRPGGQKRPVEASKGRKVAIVGGNPNTASKAPFDDPAWEIWVHGNQMDRWEGKRVTRIFEIHDDLSEHGDPRQYAAWRVGKNLPMVVGAAFPVGSEKVEAYPFESVNRFMGEHLTSTPAHMMGYALHLGDVAEIAIYGVDMAVDDHEYFLQRPAMYAWIGYALGRGIKVSIPRASSLFKDAFVEGRGSGGKPKLALKPFTEAQFRLLHVEHTERMDEIRRQMDQLQSDFQTHDGARQAYEKMANAARAVESGQVIETLTQTTVIL